MCSNDGKPWHRCNWGHKRGRLGGSMTLWFVKDVNESDHCVRRQRWMRCKVPNNFVVRARGRTTCNRLIVLNRTLVLLYLHKI